LVVFLTRRAVAIVAVIPQLRVFYGLVLPILLAV